MGSIYSKKGDVITIVITDHTFREIGSWKFNVADKELGKGILQHIQRKYGLTPEIKPSESVDELNKKKPVDFLDMSCDW